MSYNVDALQVHLKGILPLLGRNLEHEHDAYRQGKISSKDYEDIGNRYFDASAIAYEDKKD